MATDPGYPEPRLDRGAFSTGGAAVATAGAAPSPPVTRVFPFILTIGTSLRSSRSSPKLYGPALVKGLHVSKTGTAKGVLGIGLGKSVSAVTETGVAIATARPFTPLFDTMLTTLSLPDGREVADAFVDSQSSLHMDDDSLGIVILDPEFFLVVFGSSAGASGDTLVGHVTILERVSPEVIAAFL